MVDSRSADTMVFYCALLVLQGCVGFYCMTLSIGVVVNVIGLEAKEFSNLGATILQVRKRPTRTDTSSNHILMSTHGSHICIYIYFFVIYSCINTVYIQVIQTLLEDNELGYTQVITLYMTYTNPPPPPHPTPSHLLFWCMHYRLVTPFLSSKRF